MAPRRVCVDVLKLAARFWPKPLQFSLTHCAPEVSTQNTNLRHGTAGESRAHRVNDFRLRVSQQDSNCDQRARADRKKCLTTSLIPSGWVSLGANPQRIYLSTTVLFTGNRDNISQ